MDASRSGIKCLKSTCEIIFYCIWWLKFCNLYIKQPFPPGALKKKCSEKHLKIHRQVVICRCSVKGKDVLKNLATLTVKHLFRSLFFNKVAGWKPETFRSSHWRCSVKQGALKNFANFTGSNLCWSLFLIKLDIWCLQLNPSRLRHRCFPVKFAIILKKILYVYL